MLGFFYACHELRLRKKVSERPTYQACNLGEKGYKESYGVAGYSPTRSG